MPRVKKNEARTRKNMPKGKQFSKAYQPKKHTGPYLTTILEKLLKTKIKSADREVMAALKEAGLPHTKAVALGLRYLYNGLEGDTKAIEGIFDRIDGKVPQRQELSGEVSNPVHIYLPEKEPLPE